MAHTAERGYLLDEQSCAPVVKVREPWFELIVSGGKTVEGRPGSKYAYLKGRVNRIILTSGERSAVATVKDVHLYPDLDSYLATEWRKCVPDAETIEEARRRYLDIKVDGVAVFGPDGPKMAGGVTAIELDDVVLL